MQESTRIWCPKSPHQAIWVRKHNAWHDQGGVSRRQTGLIHQASQAIHNILQVCNAGAQWVSIKNRKLWLLSRVPRKLVAVFSTTFYGLSGRWWRRQANCLPIPPVEGKYHKMRYAPASSGGPSVYRNVGNCWSFRNLSSTWWPSLNYDSFAGLNYAACLACVKEYGHVFDQVWF